MKKLICGIMLCGTPAFAANNLDTFKEAYLATPVDNRSFHESVEFFGQDFHAELTGTSFILRDATLKMSGNITWQYTDPATNATSGGETIPYYISQTGDSMTMYVSRQGRWRKFNLPAVPVKIADRLKTTDINILTQNIQAVKDVEIVREDNAQRVMNVVLDGKKCSELISADNLTDADQDFLNHLRDAIAETDFTVSWTIDKSTWRTVSATVNLTDIMRAYAKDILGDAAKGELTLSDSDRHFYESLGYYAELHSRTAYLPANDSAQPVFPAEASSATSNSAVFADLAKMVARESQR